MRQRDRQDLIRPALRIVASLFGVDNVEEIAFVGVPESPVERALGMRCPVAVFDRRSVAVLVGPLFHQLQRVVPQRVDLHRLAAPRRDDPVVDLRVHPRELIALRALRQQAVLRVDVNAEMRAAHVAVDDALESRI